VTDFIDQVSVWGLGELAETMGVELVEVSADRLVGRMPVAGNRQPFGLLHGGASVVLAETLGSIAANIHAGPERVAVGIEVSATHHRSATSGHVTGTATAISLGRTLATYEIVIVDDQQRRTCSARLTCLLRGRPSV
jgi:1,4-dihydroxy-2-naphthoyl-CoA hydrolase